MAPAQRRIRRLEAPGDERREPACLFLQLVKFLEVIDAVLVVLAHSKHHGGSCPHADLVCCAMHVDPILGQALQTRNLVAHFVVENLGAPTGNRIQPGIPKAQNRVANRKSAILSDRNNLRCRVAVQVHLGKALLNPAQHLFVPVDLQVRMQAALHEYAGATQFHRLADLLVNRLEVENVSFLCRRSFQGPVKRAEGTVLRAKIRVINVAVDDVGDYAFRMKLAAN